ncbi:MAG: 2-C-methyl-D-erythritol 2,4-cyclodiphosphate synthase [bacterium]
MKTSPAPGNETYPRIGFGFDVHRFAAGRKLVLGGVEIPHEKGLDGHSDADIVLHAAMDALLGAGAFGDIGKHFPNTDPHYKDISSLLLLSHVGELLAKERYSVINIDISVVMEKPKLLPYIEQMRANIARSLNISPDSVSVKATTNEGLGFIGHEEGAAAHAVASIIRH